jgi:uncharacterized membrane protein
MSKRTLRLFIQLIVTGVLSEIVALICFSLFNNPAYITIAKCIILTGMFLAFLVFIGMFLIAGQKRKEVNNEA